jgi:hypothetical protein
MERVPAATVHKAEYRVHPVWSVQSHRGHPDIQTPYVVHMAGEGVRFDIPTVAHPFGIGHQQRVPIEGRAP